MEKNRKNGKDTFWLLYQISFHWQFGRHLTSWKLYMGAFMSFKATDTVLHYSVHSGNELYEEIIQVQSACTEKGNSDHNDYF